jgi:glyoxylate/hydroxypyruvate reductase A
MQLLFHAFDSDPTTAVVHEWMRAFRAALPEARTRLWYPGDTAPAEYAIVWKPPIGMLQERTNLKAIFNLGAGVDAILKLGDGLPNGVPLIRLDDAGMGEQMADYVLHSILRYFRRFDDFAQQQRDGVWQSLAIPDKQNFPIGILGMGVLGSRIATAIKKAGFPVHGWSRTDQQFEGIHAHAGPAGLDHFLGVSKIVVCVLPLTPETTGLLNVHALRKMQRGSYLINVARGAHVVEEDLLMLVQDGHIAGATLDVCRQEPLPPDHPFWTEPRITLTPHISAVTRREQSVQQIVTKIRRLQEGLQVAGVVNRSKGY